MAVTRPSVSMWVWKGCGATVSMPSVAHWPGVTWKVPGAASGWGGGAGGASLSLITIIPTTAATSKAAPSHCSPRPGPGRRRKEGTLNTPRDSRGQTGEGLNSRVAMTHPHGAPQKPRKRGIAPLQGQGNGPFQRRRRPIYWRHS
ncbi:hypothetical protein AZA_46219 [Nitrospirillum viridazoti Y2]|nr:hypothetical protein AZA_46219 [Nitrospirillum amazonense Y2]